MRQERKRVRKYSLVMGVSVVFRRFHKESAIESKLNAYSMKRSLPSVP